LNSHQALASSILATATSFALSVGHMRY
jgi:hypothetical protein